MKNFLIILLVTVAISAALFALFTGWNVYRNHVNEEYKKFLPEAILTFERDSVTKRPNTSNRAVDTSDGQKPIYLEGGYRAFYTTQGKLPFLRIHPEKATKDSFNNNKLTIEKEYQYLNSQNKKDVFTKKTYSDHEYYLVGDPENEGSGVRESATIFFPEDSMHVTIYFFNQGQDPTKWDYTDSKEYIVLRDQFIAKYIDYVLEQK